MSRPFFTMASVAPGTSLSLSARIMIWSKRDAPATSGPETGTAVAPGKNRCAPVVLLMPLPPLPLLPPPPPQESRPTHNREPRNRRMVYLMRLLAFSRQHRFQQLHDRKVLIPAQALLL